MLTREEYEDALKLAHSYMNVNPTPESRYGQRLTELLELIGEYERAHRLKSGIIRYALERALLQKAGTP